VLLLSLEESAELAGAKVVHGVTAVYDNSHVISGPVLSEDVQPKSQAYTRRQRPQDPAK